MLTLASCIAVLALVVLISFVGNIGFETKENLELQNAADAAAYSSAVWAARGMNAVTAANHLMGEATAIAVLLDGFGGPMLGTGRELNSDLSLEYDKTINAIRPFAEMKAAGVLSSAVAPIDGPIVDKILSLLTDDRVYAGAAIFDAKITLKYGITVALVTKAAAQIAVNIGGVVQGTPAAYVGILIEGAGVAAHVAATKYMIDIAVEWAVLQATESMVEIGNAPAVRSALRDALIPILGHYADNVAGNGRSGNSHVNIAIGNTLNDLTEQHRLADAATFPLWQDFRLPLVSERRPIERGPVTSSDRSQPFGPWSRPDRGWDGNFTDPKMEALFGGYQKISNAIQQVGNQIERILGPVSQAAGVLGDFLNIGGGGQNSNNVSADVAELIRKAGKLSDVFASLPAAPSDEGFAENPCLEPSTPAAERLPEFYWQAERSSQWARATYPYVDDYRGPILNFFKQNAPLSNAATYYANWTNKYALSISYELRKSVQMQVLADMQPRRKGFERWTTDADRAEELFTLLAVVSREPQPALFAPVLFKRPSSLGPTAVAQALVYNANGRDMAATAADSPRQPNTGWDTLNWTFPIWAPEWGRGTPSLNDGNPFAVFSRGRPAGLMSQTNVNWRVKLVPVSRGRVDGAASSQLGGQFKSLQLLQKNADLLRH